MCSTLQHVQCTCVKPSRGRVQELDTVSCSSAPPRWTQERWRKGRVTHHLATKQSRLLPGSSQL